MGAKHSGLNGGTGTAAGPSIRPIIFSPPMIRAILAGRKVVTRRVVTNKTALEWLAPGMFSPRFVAARGNHLCPYGNRGDLLYVRERFCTIAGTERTPDVTLYAADYPDSILELETLIRRKHPQLARSEIGNPWRPSIHMPRKVARLWLRIRHIQCERVQAITEYGAKLEGFAAKGGRDGLRYAGGGTWISEGHPNFESCLKPSARAEFACLWDTLNGGGRSFAANPWVWVVHFEQCPAPE